MKYVCFISDGHGHIAVNVTDNPVRLLKQYQAGNPFRLSSVLEVCFVSDEGAEDLYLLINLFYQWANISGNWFIEEPIRALISQKEVRIGNISFYGIGK